MKDSIRIAGITGSLRRGSYNTAALRALADFTPQGAAVEILTLEEIPLYSEDIEAQGFPPPVARLQARVKASHGVLFATPEYNYSIAGVLKNAIDWLSRPVGGSSIYGKPVAILGASPSTVGTARAQAHLRQVAYYNMMPLLPRAEVLISQAGEKFDGEGKLQDDETERFLSELIRDFCTWIERLDQPDGQG